MAAEERRLAQVVHLQQAGGEAVFHVVGAVGDLVRQVGDLGFERRRTEAGEFVRNRAGIRGMGEDAVAGFAGQVQAGEVRVGAFEFGDDPVGLQVVLETPAVLHQVGERVFAGVAEGGMPQVVGESDRFGEVFVQAERAGRRSGDLGDFEGMGQPGAVVVAFVVDEDLRLVLEAAERAGVDDAVAVPLVGRPVGVVRFRPAAPRRGGAPLRRRTEALRLDRFRPRAGGERRRLLGGEHADAHDFRRRTKARERKPTAD